MPLKELDAVPELRDDPSLKDFNDVATLAKSHKETKAFVGSSIRPPGPDASPEARKEFYEKLVKHAPELVPLRDGDAEAEKVVWGKLGRPEKREDYAFKVPDGVDINLEGLRDAAEAGGLTKAQFTKLAEKAVLGAQAQALSTQKDREALRTEWGAAYETKLKNAAAVAQKMGQPEAVVGAIMAGKLSSGALKTWDAIAVAVPGEGSRARRPAAEWRWRGADAGRGQGSVQGNPGAPGVLQQEPPRARGLRREGASPDAAVASRLDSVYKKSCAWGGER
jgi:hypothetical protein